MVNIPTYEDLSKLTHSTESFPISSIKGEEKSHVFSDPYDFSYKFVRCTYSNKKKIFNHVEIDEEIFDDFSGEKDSIIKCAIKKLNENGCWKIFGSEGFTVILNCEKCKQISR